METVMHSKESLSALVSLFDWHTRLYQNALDGIEEKDATNRLNTDANHIAWIAGSLLFERYTLANALGVKKKQTNDELFRNNQGIKDNADYPSLETFRKDWSEISPLLKEAINQLDEDQLNGPDPFEMPGQDLRLFDSISFITHREAYCIGQIGLWRRLLGYPATKYD